MICGILNIRLRNQELEVGHPLEVLKSKWMFKTKVLENQINSSLSVEMCGVGFFLFLFVSEWSTVSPSNSSSFQKYAQ